MNLVEAKIMLIELREGLLTAEIDKRWALENLDVKGFLAACDRIKKLTNACLMAEAKILMQERTDELLPTRKGSGTAGERSHESGKD